jgi:hypothetical protein
MVDPNQREMRSLLVLWSLGASQGFIKKSDLPKHYRNREIWQLLLNSGSIQEDKEKREIINKNQKTQVVSIKTVKFTTQGLKQLANGLNSSFVFQGKPIDIRLANAVLEWFRENQGQTIVTELQSQPIKDYDEFKQVALETYDRLNYEFNYNKLVPVYLIRRAIDNRVTRTQFNDWMLEMHRSHILHLYGGGFVDATDDQIRDSIYNDVLKTLYFAAEKLHH